MSILTTVRDPLTFHVVGKIHIINKQTITYIIMFDHCLKKILQVELYIMFVKIIGNSIASRWCATSAILFELKTGSRILFFLN